MTIKLNLTIEEKTAKQIKAYARKRKTSVSKIAEEHFSSLIKKHRNKNGKEKSFVERAGGIIKDISITDINKERDIYLKEKHGL